MISQIKIRRGTTAEWAAAHPVVLVDGEPGYDSTLKLIKIGDGVTNWASLPFQKSDNSDKLDGVHLADIRLGQNILHGWDFRNPVNQRGVSGAISSGTYFFDRWIRNSGTVTVAAGYLTLASGAVIEQRIEGLYLAGATVTASVKVGSNIYSGTGVFPTAAGTVSVTLTGFGTATLGYNANYMYVQFTASGSQNVVSVKCELGPVSTLHLDPPMDHAVELPKCQRFFRKGFRMHGNCVSALSSSVTIAIPIDNPFRIGPTISIPSYTNLLVCPNVAEYTPTSHTVDGTLTRYVLITFLGTFTGVNYGMVIASTSAGGDVSMSADL